MQNDKYSVVVVDLGTDLIKAALADKLPDGTLDIRERAEVSTEGCIVRGVIFNQKVTAEKLGKLLQELEDKVGDDSRITKVYASIGGQSLRSRERELDLPFPDEREITAEDLSELTHTLEYDTDSEYATLETVDPLYHVNGNLTADPIGIKAKSLKVKIQQILVKKKHLTNLHDVLEDKLGLEIAGIYVSPIILGNTFLTKEQKKLGSALIDFGCGCTTVALYNNGVLAGLRTFPLGSQNITIDLTALHIGLAEAERVKKNDASADTGKVKDEKVLVKNADERSSREIPLYEINQYVEARSREIVDNIAAFVQEVLGQNSLPGGVVLTGDGSRLKELPQLVTNVLQTKVQIATKSTDDANTFYLAKLGWNLIYSMTQHADTPCLEEIPDPVPEQPAVQNGLQTTVPISDFPEDTEHPEQQPLIPEDELGDPAGTQQSTPSSSRPVKRRKRKAEKQSGSGFWGKVGDMFSSFMPPEDDEDEDSKE